MTAGRRRWTRIAALAACVTLCACARDRREPGYPERPGPDMVSVMSYNVGGFGYRDRDGSGQDDNFKPEEEIRALLDVIRTAQPDILAVQEIGDQDAFALFRRRLQEAGLDYPYADYVSGHTRHANLGLLSRHPITARNERTQLSYSIRDKTIPVQRGFQQVDIAVAESVPLRLVHVHLKSKTFHEAGQTEMRRNEARLLATLVRRMLREHPEQLMLVCGDFSDTESSAALRELLGPGSSGLRDLPVADRFGDQWTFHSRREPGYFRTSYFMVNDALHARWREDYSGIVRDRRAGTASDHRPIVAVFSATAPSPARHEAGKNDPH